MNQLDYNLPLHAFLKALGEIDYTIAHHTDNRPAHKDYFHYIPCYDDSLLDTLLRHRHESSKHKAFLDVGCGSGRVMALVRYLYGCPVKGVEILKPIAELGMDAYNLKDCIYIGDAFKIITKEFMKNVDFVYTYMPIRNIPQMFKLHMHLWRKIPSGKSIRRIEMLPRYLGMEDISNKPSVLDIQQYPYSCS